MKVGKQDVFCNYKDKNMIFFKTFFSKLIWMCVKFCNFDGFCTNHHIHLSEIVVTVTSLDLDFQLPMSWSLLCSRVWGERWLFVLLTLVEFFTITILNFLFINSKISPTKITYYSSGPTCDIGHFEGQLLVTI